MNCTIAVSGTDSNLPSALTNTVFACALMVGGFCAGATSVASRQNNSVAFINAPGPYMIERDDARSLQDRFQTSTFRQQQVTADLNGPCGSTKITASCESAMSVEIRG